VRGVNVHVRGVEEISVIWEGGRYWVSFNCVDSFDLLGLLIYLRVFWIYLGSFDVLV